MDAQYGKCAQVELVGIPSVRHSFIQGLTKIKILARPSGNSHLVVFLARGYFERHKVQWTGQHAMKTFSHACPLGTCLLKSACPTGKSTSPQIQLLSSPAHHIINTTNHSKTLTNHILTSSTCTQFHTVSNVFPHNGLQQVQTFMLQS